jgi:hypothetical protein
MLAGAAVQLFCNSVLLVICCVYVCDINDSINSSEIEGVCKLVKCANWFCAIGPSYFHIHLEAGDLKSLSICSTVQFCSSVS